MNAVLISALKIAAVSYLGIFLLVYLKQAGYVYCPSKDVMMTPEDIGLAFEEVVLSTEDGERIACWFIPGDRNEALLKGVVLFCHGNAGNMGDRMDSVATFHRMGLDVALFDYRGYGASTGKPSEKGTYRDVEAVWKYLTSTRGVPSGEIMIFGRSLGGAVASWLAVRVEPSALVVESTFTSAVDMAGRMFPYLPTGLLCRFRYDNISRIGKVDCPILIAHSPDDMTIPYAHGKRLFENAGEPKCFIEMSGDHNDGGMDSDSGYQRKLVEFLKEKAGFFTRGEAETG